MSYVQLSAGDLILGAVLILLLGASSLRLGLGIERSILTASLRTVIQLFLVGYLLRFVFAASQPGWILLIALVMLLVAGREVMARQTRRFTGFWGYGMGSLAMFVSAFSLTFLALTVMIRTEPWYEARFALPLLGMLLGNTMNGIGLSLERLSTEAWRRRREIEARLLLGETWREAMSELRRDSLKSGMIPVLNALSAAGVVHLPGMMTGQILAGADPVEAVKYQILIMFLIAAGTGFGSMTAVHLGSRRLFDDRQRLRLERLRAPR